MTHFIRPIPPDHAIGIVPNFPAPPPEPAGPPTLLETLSTRLKPLLREAREAARNTPSRPAGSRVVAEVEALCAAIRALPRAGAIPSLPPTGLLTLGDLLPALRAAEAALARLKATEHTRQALAALPPG